MLFRVVLLPLCMLYHSCMHEGDVLCLKVRAAKPDNKNLPYKAQLILHDSLELRQY